MGTFKLMATMFGMGVAVTLGMGAAFVAAEVSGMSDWLEERHATRKDRLNEKHKKRLAKEKEKVKAKRVKAKAARKKEKAS